MVGTSMKQKQEEDLLQISVTILTKRHLHSLQWHALHPCHHGRLQSGKWEKNLSLYMLFCSLLGIYVPRYLNRFLRLYKLACCVLLLDIISTVILYIEISRLIYKHIASSDRCLQPLHQVKLLIWLSLSNSALFLHRTASYRIWVGKQLHSENVSFSVCQPEQFYLLYSILPWKVGMISSTSYSQNK